jgi:hypothetical protein
MQAAAIVAALLAPSVSQAQTDGVIAGVVKDSSGGTIPGATVKVVNEGSARRSRR